MDDYDPACPTEDDIQFAELDLSQVPLPPSFPTIDESTDRDTASIPPGPPSELGREGSQKGRRKRRKHEGSRPQTEEKDDKEVDNAEEPVPVPQVPVPQGPVPTLSHEDPVEMPVVEPVLAVESEIVPDVNVTAPPPSATLTTPGNQDSVVPSTAAASSTAPLPKPAKLHFKLTQDPSGGKAKVSFQLKKSLRSAFHAAEDNEEEGENAVKDEVVKDIVEKTAAGEYIPTRFKVSKKHEMFRPSLIEPGVTVIINSSLINTAGSSNSNVITAQTVDTNILPASVAKIKDIDDPQETGSATNTARDVRKDRITRFGRDSRNSRKEDEDGKNKETVDSQRELRRSERRDRQNENNNSRSTRRSSRGSDRDNDRYDNSRASYSRRDRDEVRQKEKEEKHIKSELGENDDRRRSARFRKNDSGEKGKEKESLDDSKQEDPESSSGSYRKSVRLEHNPSPTTTSGRRTRSSHRSKSPSRERDSAALASTEDSAKSMIPKQSADPEISSYEAASKEDALSTNAGLNTSLEEVASKVSNTVKQPSSDKSRVYVTEIVDISIGKHPQIQKIVIRRSVDSSDFEIAKGDQAECSSSDPCSAKENVDFSQEKLTEFDSPLSECDKEKVDLSEKEQSSITIVEKKELCDVEMVDIENNEQSGLYRVMENKSCDVLEEVIEKNGNATMDENKFIDETVDPAEKEKCSNNKIDETVDVEKEKGGHSSVEEKSLSDNALDEFETEKGGSSRIEENKFHDKTVDVLKKDSGRSRLVDTAVSEKTDVNEKESIDYSKVKEKQPSDKIVDLKESRDYSKVKEIRPSDKIVDLKESSDYSKVKEIRPSDKTVDVYEKESSDRSKVKEKQLSDKTVDVYEKERKDYSKVKEKRLSDKTVNEYEEESSNYSKVKEKRLSDKTVDEDEKGKIGLSEEDEKGFHDNKAIDAVEKDKGKGTKGDEKRLPGKTVEIYEKGKTDVYEKGKTDVYEKGKTDVYEKGKTVDLYEKGKKVDLYEKGKKVDLYEKGKSIDVYEKGKIRSSRGDEKRLSKKTIDISDKGKSKASRGDEKRFSDKDTFKHRTKQTYTKSRGRYRSSSSEDEYNRRPSPVKKLAAEKLSKKTSNAPLLPEQVLVDVSALPGKSKWEMDDEEEVLEDTLTKNEDRLFGRDLKSLEATSNRWSNRSQTEIVQRFSHRTHHRTESSSNEDEKSHEQKWHKRDKTDRKKKRRDEDSVHSSKLSEESEEHKEGSLRGRAVIDNSKIISYLREYSSKEDRIPKAKSEIDNTKLVTYLKEYSEKMTAESSFQESSEEEPDVSIEVDAVSKKRRAKEESSQSEVSRAAEVSLSEDLDSQRINLLYTDSASNKKKDQGSSDGKIFHSESSEVNKRESEDKSEHRELKEKHHFEASPLRSSSSCERSHRVKSPDKLIKEHDERYSQKEKRTRSPSPNASERSVSKSSQRSRDKRDRSVSAEKSRRSRRNRSRSAERQDHSQSTNRRRGRRRSKSQSPARRSRDKRNRSRSVSQDKRRDRSRSRERTYSYKSYRSPIRDSFGRTRRENRDRRDRSRSNSYDRSSDARRRDTEDSHLRASRKYNKSKSPEKKGSRTSSAGEPDSKGSSGTDKSFTIKLEPAASIDLSSIPIPFEIPLPDKELKPSVLDQTEEVQPPASIASTDVLQDEPMVCSDDVKDAIIAESQVSKTNDRTEEAADKLISVLDSSKVKMANMAEQKSQTINLATLSSGKERQIKFSIRGGDRKLKPVVVSDILEDGDDLESNIKEKEESSKSSSIPVDSDASKIDKNAPPVHKMMKIVEENVEKKEDSDTEDSKEFHRNTKGEKLTVTAKDVSDSKLVDIDANSEEIDLPQKVISNSEKETMTPSTSVSAQPQRLKFKYTPLWELEKEERKPVVEEISKKVEATFGLALDYGSESSSSEGEEDPVINRKEMGKELEDPSSGKQKDSNKSSHTEVTDQLKIQDNVSEIKDSAESLATEPNKQLKAEEEVVVKVDESCGKAQILSLVNEGCDVTGAADFTSEEDASSAVLSEVDEAYSPSHPSMEDVEDLTDIATPSTPKGRRESTSKIESKSSSYLEGKATGGDSASPCISTTESHEVTIKGSVPFIMGAVSTTAALSHQLSIIPQVTPMPIKKPDTAVPHIPMVTSLVGQSFLGLHMPYSHSSLLGSALSVPQPVPPPGSTLSVPQLVPPPGPTLLVPQPVPPPSAVPATQHSGISFPSTSDGPKPVPPPLQLSSLLPQTTLAFGGISLPSSLIAAPQATSIWDAPAFPLKTQSSFPRAASAQGINSQLLGVQGVFGPQGVTIPALRDVIPIPGSLPEGSVGSHLGCTTLPSLGTLPVLAQSSQSSNTTVVQPTSIAKQKGIAVDSSPNDTPIKFRISRFNQGPPSTHAIPPPTVAIPPPSLALPTTLGVPTAALANNSASVPSVQQHTTSLVPKSINSKQVLSSISSQKTALVARDLPTISTHSKRPKISSILSQPKIEDLAVLETLSAMDIRHKPPLTVCEELSSVKSQLPSDHNIALLCSIPASEKQREQTISSTVQETNIETKSPDDSLCKHHHSSEDVALAGTVKSTDIVSKEVCTAEQSKQSKSPAEDVISSVTDSSHSLEGPILEPVSSSMIPPEMSDIPLPGEPASQASIPPQAPVKTDPHSPPKLSPATAIVTELNTPSTLVLPSPKGQTHGPLKEERKKRFSQSPLAIGMLPKFQITQSPLAAGPLPKLPPEPEVSKSFSILPKKTAASPGAMDTKSTLQLSLATKQKKPQAEIEEPKSIPKVHFVFKSKAVVQRTLISAFDDDGSDESGGESQSQATSSEPSHFESNILSVFGEEQSEVQQAPAALLGKAIPDLAVVTDAEKHGPPRDTKTTVKDCDDDLELKSKIVSLTDIEAFPVQVITSTRKEEMTPSSSWPEFTVGKKEKENEEQDRDGGSKSYDREEKSRKRSRRISRERDDSRDERKRKSRYEGEEGKKIIVRKNDDRRSDDENDDEYDSRIRIKKEKEDYIDRPHSGQEDRENGPQKSRHYDEDDDRRRGRDVKDIDSYSKRSSRFDDDNDYRRGKGRDAKEDKYNRRRGGDNRDEDYGRRKYDDDNRRVRSFERERISGSSRERARSRERERSSIKLSGKRSHRSRDISHSRSRSRSRSPSRRRDRGRDRSRDRYDREKSRSRSHERGLGSSSRRKDLKSFKEELMEELTKPSGKVDPKDDLFKAAAINCTSQSYVFDYHPDPVYSSSADNTYSQPPPHHDSEVTAGYHGHDHNLAAQYPPSYDHQQYDPHWQNQPAQNMYNQVLTPQHQDMPNQYPPIPQEQVTAPHPYPFQPVSSHYPQPHYPNNQTLQETFHQVPSILHQQIPQLQHPASGPQPPQFHMDQHGQMMPPHYPNSQHQPAPLYPPPGPQNHFQPPTFTQESMPSFTPLDFHSHFGQRPRAPLLPNPIRTPMLRSPIISHNIIDTSNFGSPKFSSPEVVPSLVLQNQSDIRPSKKFKFGTLEEGTFSPTIKSSLATCSSPTVGSPSTSGMTTSDAVYPKPGVADVFFGLSTIPEPSFETSLLAESEFDSTEVQEAKKLSKSPIVKKKNSLEVNEPTVSSSGVEDSTGDTGSDSGTDSSSQRPLKVKSRWRRNSEAEAVVDTSTPLPPIVKQALSRSSTPNDTPDSSPKERRRTRSRAAAEEFSSQAAQLAETPPPPPPPRKRIKIEPETAENTEEQETEASRDSQEDGSKVQTNEVQDLASLMARPDFPKFEIIPENIHLTERKRSKSMKRMLCDCTTSREERSKGLMACGSDCLNRMLMIECNSRCPCGDYCTNKRFQKKQYSHTAPFKAGDKGWGLIAGEDMEEKGTFIMEYVGELLDYEEFVRRTRQYSKLGLVHHYFMALNADEVVDATLKGSISRFINHSCDPNCETQKWTVNGELRVGFFTRKVIKKGEELTFDYQFEHYGEAQKCYCGSENCRGFIGLVKSPTRNNRRKEKKKREIFKDELLEEDIAKLSLLDGMRNKNHVLDLCRLMVRAEKVQHRMAILKILQDTAESACLRLFLDYHGLPLLWSWMADIGTTDYSPQTQELKLLMLSVLKSLPITNKTALKESKIPDMVDRWAVAAVVAARKPPPPPPPATTAITLITKTTKAIDSMASRTTLTDNEAVAAAEATTLVEEAVGSVEEDAEKAAEPEATTSSESSPPASPPPLLPPLLSTITPVSILASAKDSKDSKRKRRVTFAEIPVESEFSPDPPGGEENDDISSSTQSSGEKEGVEDGRALVECGDISGNEGHLLVASLPGEATASGEKRFGIGEGKMLKFSLKSDEILSGDVDESLSGDVADSTSQKYNFDSGGSSGTASDADNSDTETLIKDPLASLAAECVSLWSTLKEVFKIPKRERVEERKRTERELDVLSKKDPETSDPFAKWKKSKVMRLSKRKVLEDDERKFGAPKMSKEERRQLFEAQVKAEDEMVAQAYAEEYQRQQEAYILHQQRLLDDPQYFYFHQQHQGDPNFAGMDPSMIPPEGLTDPISGESLIDPHTGQPVLDMNTGQAALDPNTGQPMIDQSLGRPLVLHAPQIDPNTGQPMVHTHHIDPQTGQPIHHLDPHTGQLVNHLDPLTGQLLHQIDPLTGQPLHQIDPITGQPHHIDPITGQPLHQLDPITRQPITPQIDPSTGQPIQHQMDPIVTHPHIQSGHTHFDPHLGQPVPHPHPINNQTVISSYQQQPQAQHLSGTTQNQILVEAEFEEEVPPPPSPPTVPVTKLPPNWKTAKDSEGRVYYYHAFTRQTQWEMPSWDDNEDDSDDMDLDPNPVDEVIKAKKKTTTAAADTSSEVARKIKDQFRSKMSNFIVTYLNPYRKQDCKIGRIVSTDDFKHLARKLTHHVMSKELKHCRHVEDLEVNENVKAKAKDYVRKYMSKFGSIFKKSSSPHPDDSSL